MENAPPLIARRGISLFPHPSNQITLRHGARRGRRIARSDPKKQTRSRAERLTHPLLEKFAQVPVPPASRLKKIASSHCSLMTSKGNSRANEISERESNNQPDCEDDHGIGHTSTDSSFPSGLGRDTLSAASGGEQDPVSDSGLISVRVQLVMTLHARCVVTSSGPSRRHSAAGRWMIRCT